jgi:hypothetical protein
LKRVTSRLIVDPSVLWPIAATVILLVTTGLILRYWKTSSLPVRLIPVDALTIILLVDLNIKSNRNVTLADPVMKVEAIAFTVLLAFILFLPVLWKVAFDRTNERR